MRNKRVAKAHTTMATLERRDESLPSLFARLTDELAELFKAKLDLLKIEMKQEASVYALRIALILVGVVIATVGFALLNVAIAFFISTLFNITQGSPAARYGIGFVITAFLYLVIGAIVVVVAKNRLAKERIVPRTTAELKRDKQFLKQEF